MLRFCALGEPRLLAPRGELLRGRRKELALLAYLAWCAPLPVRRDELIGLFWSERPEARARQSLRQALLQLRRILGESLVVERSTVTLSQGAVELDSRALAADVASLRPDAAVARWRGDFLAGAEEAGGEAFRAWVETERQACRRSVAAAFCQLVEARRAVADWDGAVREAEQWAGVLPLDERAHRHWLEALSQQGRPEEALTVYEAFAARLRRDAGAEPSAGFERLHTVLRTAADRRESNGLARAGSAALFTPDLTGRAAAQAELSAAWQFALGGGSATVLVEGVGGMGRTMLSEQFLLSLEEGERAPVVLRGRGHAGEATWQNARALLAPLADAPGVDGASGATLGRVSWLVPGLRERFPGLPDPPRTERELVAAVTRVLAHVAEQAPLAVFVDDLPEADAASRDLVLHLVRHPVPGMLLLVTAQASEHAAAVVTKLCHVPGVRRIRLTTLSGAEFEAMLQSMIALEAGDLATLAARLHAETGGNPGHAAEIVGAMVDDGQLVPDRAGVWRLAPGLADQPLPLPASVRQALRRRLDRLNDAAAHVLAAAAALPEPVSRARLQRAAALAPDRFQEGLDEVIARRLLRSAPASGETLEFTHRLTRRVAAERVAAAGPPARATAHRARWGLAAAAVALLVLFFPGAAFMRAYRAADPPPVLAVAPFAMADAADTTGTPAVIAALLATNLARLSGVEVVSSVRMYELLNQLGGGGDRRAPAGAWAAAARHAGATELLEGELHRTVDRLRLDLRRVDLRSGIVRAAWVVSGADAFELADRATAGFGASLGSPDGVLRVADVTTSSLIAYRFYEEGLRSSAVGDFRAAAKLFDAALAEDPDFALAAHHALANRLALHQPVPAEARQTVLRLADRAAERDRLRIRSAWGAGDMATRFALADSFATRHPTDPDGHLLLGGARLEAGHFAAALVHFERVVAMDSLGLAVELPGCRACTALSRIIFTHELADSMAAAERVAREWIRRQPRSASAWHALATALELQEHYDDGAAARRTAISLAPGHPFEQLFPALTRIRAGDYAGADAILVHLARTAMPDVQGRALWYLAISLRNQGRLQEALTTLERARSIGVDSLMLAQHEAQVLIEMGHAAEAARRFHTVAAATGADPAPAILARHRSWNLTHVAVARAAAGDTSSLAALADSVRSWGLRSAYGRDPLLHHHVRGLLLAARNRPEAAAAEFRRAIYSPGFGHTRTNLELARVLLGLGRNREAVAVLQPALRGALDGSNLYVTRTELHELLGRAWEAGGRPDSAAVHYRRVLDAWSAADPQYRPRYAAAEARLAALRLTARAAARDSR